MSHTNTLHHSFTLNDAQFQFELVLACMLALAVVLVYFFPSHDDPNSWTPESVMDQTGS